MLLHCCRTSFLADVEVPFGLTSAHQDDLKTGCKGTVSDVVDMFVDFFYNCTVLFTNLVFKRYLGHFMIRKHQNLTEILFVPTRPLLLYSRHLRCIKNLLWYIRMHTYIFDSVTETNYCPRHRAAVSGLQM